ncbi:MAG: hypothetical protein NTY53_22100 [Kiritimatiellaeota bacterium]|nr:hypothetical protein [Kiritimatiellota bacterium]
MNIYLDIETLPLPVAEREFLRPSEADVKTGNLKDPAKIAAKIAEAREAWELGEDAALDSLQARIALVGFAVEDGPVQQVALEDEAELLRQLWREISPKAYASEIQIIGHNIRFDAGMLAHRSWLKGVVMPSYLINDLYGYSPRYWQDTMLRWQLGNRQADYRKLQHLCAAFGIAAKQGPVTGENFAEWWSDDREACLAYNKQDVEAVRALWQRLA